MQRRLLETILAHRPAALYPSALCILADLQQDRVLDCARAAVAAADAPALLRHLRDLSPPCARMLASVMGVLPQGGLPYPGECAPAVQNADAAVVSTDAVAAVASDAAVRSVDAAVRYADAVASDAMLRSNGATAGECTPECSVQSADAVPSTDAVASDAAVQIMDAAVRCADAEALHAVLRSNAATAGEYMPEAALSRSATATCLPPQATSDVGYGTERSQGCSELPVASRGGGAAKPATDTAAQASSAAEPTGTASGGTPLSARQMGVHYAARSSIRSEPGTTREGQPTSQPSAHAPAVDTLHSCLNGVGSAACTNKPVRSTVPAAVESGAVESAAVESAALFACAQHVRAGASAPGHLFYPFFEVSMYLLICAEFVVEEAAGLLGRAAAVEAAQVAGRSALHVLATGIRVLSKFRCRLAVFCVCAVEMSFARVDHWCGPQQLYVCAR